MMEEKIYESFAENSSNVSLFLFTIGPVQQFIFQARKTQDLFMGSFLLSYLTFIGMEEVIDRYGPKSIIYPNLSAQPLMEWHLKRCNINRKSSISSFIDQPTIPNRFVALIPESEESKIIKLAHKMEDAVRKKWKEMVDIVLNKFKLIDKIRSDKKDEDCKAVIKKQTLDFPEIYWVAMPFKKDGKYITEEDFKDFFEEVQKENVGLIYHLGYSALEKSMGIRKNLRNFSQTNEYGKKCNICGTKEGVIKAGMGSLQVGKYISEKEALCIPCFVKRALDKYLGDKVDGKFIDYTFPSTAEMASSNFKKRALKDAEVQFNAYIDNIKKIVGENVLRQIQVKPLNKIEGDFNNVVNIEGEWFFEENLCTENIKKQFGIEIDDKEIKDLRKSLKQITDEVGEPNPYYAVVLFDGDNMGEWLAGKLLHNFEHIYGSDLWNKLPNKVKEELKTSIKNKLLTPTIHFLISLSLRNYSLEFVKKIVEDDHLGKLIYSGGDDVLAFVNLKDLFEVMRRLRAAFSGHIKIENNEIKVDWSNNTGFVEKDGKLLLTMGKNATASCGVVIAHYKTPLKMVMDKVRETEKKAKSNTEKDSFAISLLKRSGEEKIIVSKWKYGDMDVLEILKELSYLFRRNQSGVRISRRIVYTLAEEFAKLKDKCGNYIAETGIINTEIKRVVLRAVDTVSGNIGKEEKKNISKEISDVLKNLYHKYDDDIDNFLKLIEISAFIGKEGE